MIKDERQYKITSDQADRFLQALRELEKEVAESSGIHPLLLKARKEAIQSQLTDLEDDLREYEALRSGDLEESARRRTQQIKRARARYNSESRAGSPRCLHVKYDSIGYRISGRS